MSDDISDGMSDGMSDDMKGPSTARRPNRSAQSTRLHRLLAFGIFMALLGAIVPPLAANDQIIGIQGGSVSIQRQGNLRRSTAAVGTALQLGDVVYPWNGAVVTVQCQNDTVRDRSYLFSLSDVCPDSATLRFSQIGRGEDDFLGFLHNRFNYASQVADGNPILRWNPVPGARTYQLQLWNCGQTVFNCTDIGWQQTVTEPRVRYDGPPLQPGYSYQLVAIAYDSQGQEQPPLALSLRRLDADQQTHLDAAIAHLAPDTLSPEPQAIARTRLYLNVAAPNTLPPEGVGLALDAIAVLEAIASTSATPYIHRHLGDLYLRVGLLDAAQSAYETTLILSTFTPDRASRVAAQVGLANIAASRGDRTLAYHWLQQARVGYSWLGEAERLGQVESWLDSLNASSAEAPSR